MNPPVTQPTADDYRFMALALQLAERGRYTTDPNPRVGSVVVKDGAIVGQGWHQWAGQPHAEVYALLDAGARSAGATAYITLEPCCHHGRTPPCVAALREAGVSRVVTAMEDPNPRVAGEGHRQMRDAGVEVLTGVLQEQASALNAGFVKRMTAGLPLVRCKLAMSLDGRTAMASGESQWITATEARADVQRWRARSSVILTGIGTVLADDPGMTVRADQIGEPEPPGGWRQPLRVVLDPRLSTPANARIINAPGRCLIATCCIEDEAAEALIESRAEVIRFPGSLDAIDLRALLHYLAREEEANEVLLETGATLAGAMLRAGLVDELIVYMAPTVLGNDARGLFRIPGLDRMQDRIDLDITDVRAVGRDWRISAKVNPRAAT